ncbi:MAG: hypothetical protein AB8G95_19340 [Anaerolineae bacterium]
MSNQLSENNAVLSRTTNAWASITSNKSKKNRLTLLLLMAVLVLFNYLLYARLSPKEIRSLYTGSYSNEFNQPIAFESDGWFETEGNWEIADDQLMHKNFFTINPALMIPLKANPDDTVYFWADLQIESDRDGGGLRFNMETPNQIIHSHRVAILRQGDQTVLVGGYYADTLDFKNQFSLLLDVGFEKNIQSNLLIVATSDSYDVYLNGYLMIEDVPAIYPPGWYGFSALGDSTAFDRVAIEASSAPQSKNLADILAQVKTGDPVSTADTYAQTAASITDGNFLVSASNNLNEIGLILGPGSWNLRNGMLIQSAQEQADAYAIYQSPKNEYQLEIKLKHLQDQALGGGGILFGLEKPNSLENGYLARFTDDGSGFFYGKYDTNQVFEGIGFYPFLPVANESQSIILTNDGFHFDINVNGESIVQELKSSQSDTYFGFISNEAIVVFEQVSLFSTVPIETEAESADSLESAPERTQSGDSEPIQISNISGEWSIEDTAVIQTNSDPTDHVGGFNRFEEQFSFDVDITMPSNADVMNGGGGIIFNMPTQGSRNGGQIVRFLNSGAEVIWGYFGENGLFIGQSGVALGASSDETQKLGIRVHESTFEIWVNGKSVAADLPLQETEGWLGLMTFGGPVTFDNLSIQSITKE